MWPKTQFAELLPHILFYPVKPLWAHCEVCNNIPVPLLLSRKLKDVVWNCICCSACMFFTAREWQRAMAGLEDELAECVGNRYYSKLPPVIIMAMYGKFFPFSLFIALLISMHLSRKLLRRNCECSYLWINAEREGTRTWLRNSSPIIS